MPLETASYPSDLVASNPAHSDGMNNADAHLRLIKSVIKNTLGPLTAALLTASLDLELPNDGTSTAPGLSFASEPTLGIYRAGPGAMRIAGGTLVGTVPTGAVVMFLKEPPGLGKVTTDTGKDWLEINGATYNVADYPALATFLGASGSTFVLPDMYSTGRFPRSRTASVAALTAQANTVGPHTHPDGAFTTGVESADHTHPFSGTTGNDSPDHSHPFTASVTGSSTGGGSFGCGGSPGGSSTGGASTRHQHSFSGTTGGKSGTHTHSGTVSIAANTGTTETRPEALSFVFAVKT